MDKPEIVPPVLQIKQFHILNLYKTKKCGLIEETMDLSHILLAVDINLKNFISLHDNAVNQSII